jgi:hypothetical protein
MGKKEDGPSIAKLVLLRQFGQGIVGGVMVILPKQLAIKMGPSCLGEVTCALKQEWC